MHRVSEFLKKLNFSSYFLFLLLVIQLGFFIWALDRGFDFTDEAYGFIGINQPQEISQVATYYTVLYNFFFGWLPVEVVTVRIVRLLTILLSGSVLGLGLVNWFQRSDLVERHQSVNLFLFCLVGSLGINAFGTQAFTYNTMSSLIIQLITGIFLFSFNRERQFNTRDKIVHLTLGALLFALFTVKFSNALFLILMLILLLLLDKRSLKIVAIHSVYMLGGAIAMSLLLFRLDVIQWLIGYKNTLTLVAGSSGSLIWQRYVDSIVFVTDAVILKNIILISLLIVLLIVDQFVQKKSVKVIIAVVLALLVVWRSYSDNWYLGGQKYFYTFSFIYLFLLTVFGGKQVVQFVIDLARKKPMPATAYWMILILLAMPCIGVVGTNNLLQIQMMWYTAFLLPALYLLFYLNNKQVLNLMVIVLAGSTSIQAVSGLVYSPYRIKQSLHEETEQVSKNITTDNLRLNADLKKSVDDLHGMLYSKTDFSKGDPIFATADYYGFVYLLKGVLPGWGWYHEKATAINAHTIRSTKLRNLDRMILLMPQGYKMDSLYVRCFSDLKVYFPESYDSVGTVSYYLEGADRSFSVYAPKALIQGNGVQ
jgi:hypothetical protein